MTLRTRIALGLLTIALVLLAPLGIALNSLQQIHADARALRDGAFQGSLLLGRLRDAAGDVRVAETNLLILRDASSREAMANLVARVAQLADSLTGYGLDSAAAEIRAAVGVLQGSAPRQVEAVRAGRVEAADELSSREVGPAVRRLERGIGSAERYLRERTRVRVADATASIQRAQFLSAVSLALAVLIAAWIAIRLTRWITRPVRELERGMDAVAEGNFDHEVRIAPSRQDEFGRLGVSFREMASRLKALDQLRAEVISVASHELKTPINVIVGYLQLLQEGLYGDLTAKQREITRTLETQARALGRLVKQLLDVTRFQAGGGQIDPRPMDVSQFLDELENAFHVLAVQRGVRFIVTRHSGLPDRVGWDHDRMNEVLGNLLSNAFKFTPRGGEVELSAEPAEGGVVMHVRDTGAGIPPEQLPHIFEKFYQADNQRAASQEGSGLGLSIAREIVLAHGGDITCESTVGVGTTFTIVMPLQAAGRRPALER
ncbi:MAG TPA: ATP-binding protein, partial [Solirubrobacterales bacterium]|nr:ATP-binding protein [Solirubrobacterales bacterium]